MGIWLVLRDQVRHIFYMFTTPGFSSWGKYSWASHVLLLKIKVKHSSHMTSALILLFPFLPSVIELYNKLIFSPHSSVMATGGVQASTYHRGKSQDSVKPWRWHQLLEPHKNKTKATKQKTKQQQTVPQSYEDGIHLVTNNGWLFGRMLGRPSEPQPPLTWRLPGEERRWCHFLLLVTIGPGPSTGQLSWDDEKWGKIHSFC